MILREERAVKFWFREHRRERVWTVMFVFGAAYCLCIVCIFVMKQGILFSLSYQLWFS